MRILYVGNDRDAAQLAAGALLKAGQDVTVTWAGRLSDALHWVRDHQDCAAFIVEDQVQNQSCAWFVRQVRGLGLTAPIVVVSSKEAGPPLAALKAGADDYVAKDQSLLLDLPDAVSRALRPTHASGGPAQRQLRLLYLGDSALARESLHSPHCSIEITEPVRESNGHFQPIPSALSGAGQPLPVDALLVEHGRPGVDVFAILKDMAASREQVPVIMVVEWEEELILPALRLGALDYVVKNKESFQALAFRLDRVLAHSTLLKERAELRASIDDAASTRAVLEEKLERAEAVVRSAAQRHAAMATAASDLHERQAQCETELAQGAAARATLAQHLNDATLALELAEYARASDAAAVERLTRREAELAATVAEAAATREMLDRRLADAQSAIELSEQRRAADRQATVHEASQREAEYKVQLGQEVAARGTLQQKLTHAAAVVQVAAQRHASMKVALAQTTERQNQYESQLAYAAATREVLEEQLRDAAVALDQAQQARASLDATLAEITATRDTLQRRLVDAESAIQLSEQRASAADHEASLHQAELEARLNQEVTTRATVEGRLRQAEAVVRAAAERHASMTTAAAELAERQAQYEAQLAHATAARDSFEQHFNGASLALERAERARASDAAEAAERLSRRDAERAALVAEATAMRETLERRLAAAAAALQQADERGTADREASVHSASQRQAEYEAQLAQAAAALDTLEQQFSEASMALERTEQARASEAAQAAERLTRREAELAATVAEFEARLDREVVARGAVERTLERTAAALRTTVEQHASELTTAAAELADRQAQYETEFAQVIAARDTFQQQFNGASTALERSEQARASEAAEAAERLSRRDAEAAATVVEATAMRETLERRLAEADAAGRQAEQRALRERQAAAQEALRRKSEFEVRLEQEVTARDTSEKRLVRAVAALRDAAAQHASEMTTAAAELATRQMQYDAVLEQATTARDTFAQQLGEAAVAVEQAQQARVAEVASVTERFTRREEQFAATIAETTATRDALGRRLAGVEAVLLQTEERATADREAALQGTAQRQAEFEGRLGQEIAARDTVEQTLMRVEAALRDALQQHASEMATAAAQLAEREAQHDAQLAQAVAAGEALGQQLSDVTTTLEEVRLAAAHEASQRQAEFRARLDSVSVEREALERDLAEARVASDSAQQRFLEEVAAIRQRGSEHQALLQEQAARERADRQAVLADMQGRVRDLDLKGATLRQSLETSHQQIQRLEAVQKEEREGFERARMTSEAERRQLADEHARLGALLAARDALLTERDAQLKEQATSHAAWEQALSTDASNRVAQVQQQLDETRAVHRRQFERTPSSMFRCSRDGTLEQVNDALAAMLGYRTADDVRAVNVATTVFESPDDLRLLIDRCLGTGKTESLETTWTKKDGVRLIVRLLACASASGDVEIVAEDVTKLRELEEKLRQAQRMEAVGRLASEVAATCDNLLRDVSQGGHQWLETIDSGTATRHQGELLLNEVTRAASFLRQLELYGKKEASALEPVDVNRVLCDLEPVLKRVAGDDIEFVLPKTSSPVNVDVESQRVERILVNMAAYGRERLPFGGRLTFELGNVVVGRESVAEHPTFRPGPHVLITVTAVRYAVKWETSLQQAAPGNGSASALDRPGVDLGAIQALIRDCGGHLWLAAEPPGDMVLKIHLPQPAADRPVEQRVPVARSKGGRTMGRWLRTRH